MPKQQKICEPVSFLILMKNYALTQFFDKNVDDYTEKYCNAILCRIWFSSVF